MTTLSYTVNDTHFADGQPALGTDVTSRCNDIKTFLNGSFLDPTSNINVAVNYPWTAAHSWTVSDGTQDNISLVVGSVLNAAKYGLHVSSAAAQINSALVYVSLSNASSTAPCLEYANAGTGSTVKVTNTGNATAFTGALSSTSATTGVATLSQAGTGPLVDCTLRTLTGLNAECLAKKITSLTVVDNTGTETAITDLTTTLPANFLKAGTTIRGSIWGTIDTPGAGVPTGILKVYYGGTSGTVLLSSGAVTHSISLVGSLVVVDFILTCLTTGGSGTIEAQGIVSWGSNTAPPARGLGTAATGTGNTAAITIDTTQAKDLTISFKWGSAVAGATAKFRAGTIEVLT